MEQTRRNTRWTNGGDGFYRLFMGQLQYCPEGADGSMCPSEACDLDIDFLDEAEAIEQSKRMDAMLRNPAIGQGEDGQPLDFPALDTFDRVTGHAPAGLREKLIEVWFVLEGEEEWNAETLDAVARLIGFESDNPTEFEKKEK